MTNIVSDSSSVDQIVDLFLALNFSHAESVLLTAPVNSTLEPDSLLTVSIKVGWSCLIADATLVQRLERIAWIWLNTVYGQRRDGGFFRLPIII